MELDNISKWLLTGETGVSSKTIVAFLTNTKIDYVYHPSDPSDFNRCILCLDAIPELKNNFEKMKECSEQWSRLVDNWEKIKELFILEAGYNWSKKKSAPITYDLMQKIIYNKE